jgi:Aspartyl protease
MTMAGAPPGFRPTAFTCRYAAKSPRLTSEIEIFPAFVPPDQPQGKKYHALYDTGGTHSSISPQVVADLNLASIGAQNVGVGGGTLTTTAHLVNIGLPNKVMFPMMRVAKVALHGGHRCSDRHGHPRSGRFRCNPLQWQNNFFFLLPLSTRD